MTRRLYLAGFAAGVAVGALLATVWAYGCGQAGAQTPAPGPEATVIGADGRPLPREDAVDLGPLGRPGWAQVVVIETNGEVAWWGPVRRIEQAAAVAGGSVTAMIEDAARRWGLNRDQMLRIARCESGYDPRARNARSGASGVFQFLDSTWRATPQAKAGRSVFDPAANVEAAAWLMKTEGPRHWVCR